MDDGLTGTSCVSRPAPAQHRGMSPCRWIALVLPLLLAACSPAWLANWTSLPEDRALAEAAIADLGAGNFPGFARRLPGEVRPQLESQFRPMRAALPRHGATEPELVDAGWTSVTAVGGGAFRDSRLTYEIAGSDRRALVQMMIRRQGRQATITAFNVSRIDRPAIEINAFRPGDGGLDNYAVALLALAGFTVTFAAIRRVWISGNFRHRWLWTAGCLIGFCRFSTVWGTSHIGFAPLGITLFSAGAARQGLGPWTIIAGLPLVAIWALLRQRSL